MLFGRKERIMNDLISRISLKQSIAASAILKDKKTLEQIIDEEPSIDAVPVIRCKDCKWWDEKEGSPYGYCMAMKHGYFSSNWEIGIYRTYKGDWFCADGERKES